MSDQPPPYDPGQQPPPNPGQPPQYNAPPPPPPGYALSAPSGAGLYQDPTSGVLLPQGTTLATAGRRIGAYFLAIPLAIVTLGIGYLIWGLIAWGKGTTPALQVLGMKVWRPADQRPASWGQMALREIVGSYIAEGICIIVGIVSFVFLLSKPDRATIHDKIAGTVVIHDPNKVLG